MKIDVNYLARVEGEAAVRFEIEERRLRRLSLNIWEPPRFFEGFLRGRHYEEVPDIVARICGICPISHMTTAIRALEKALGITPSPVTQALQRLMAWSQIVASHLVHLYMLALPDYLGLASSAAMLPGFSADLVRFLRMKEVVNDLNALIGGRALHPVGMTVAGFTRPPSRGELEKFIPRLRDIREDARETLKMIAVLDVPPLANEAECVALQTVDGYAINDGNYISDEGLDAAQSEYSRYFVEQEVATANAKRTIVKGRGAILVGALARFNLKSERLHPAARTAAASLGFIAPLDNPFHNNLAQAVEVIHGIEECIEIIEAMPKGEAWTAITVREGQGAAATEAPRGVLYHAYSLNRRGEIEHADIVTPTAHNFYGLETNLRRLIETDIDASTAEHTRRCEMLVRAYDPCFSCSVH